MSGLPTNYRILPYEMPVRLSCHPQSTAEPVGYFKTQQPSGYKWMNDKQVELVVFECRECAAHADVGITREQWLGSREGD